MRCSPCWKCLYLTSGQPRVGSSPSPSILERSRQQALAGVAGADREMLPLVTGAHLTGKHRQEPPNDTPGCVAGELF